MHVGSKVKLDPQELPFMGLEGVTADTEFIVVGFPLTNWNGVSQIDLETIEGGLYRILDNGTAIEI